MASKPLIQCFLDELLDVVDKYEESGITNVEVIGAIELLKLEVYQDMYEAAKEDDEDELWQG